MTNEKFDQLLKLKEEIDDLTVYKNDFECGFTRHYGSPLTYEQIKEISALYGSFIDKRLDELKRRFNEA